MAHVRHGEGRRLPRRPGRGRGPGPRGGRDRHRARAHGPAVQPDARRQDRPAAVRGPHPQLRRGAGQAVLLRGRPDRPHDPADPLPELHQGRGAVLRRVPRRRPPLRGRRRWRRGPRGRRDRLPDRRRRAPHVPGQGRPARHRRQRPDVPDHLQRPLPDRRRDGPGLPPRDPAAGHGVLPVPPDRPVRPGHPPLRGGPRRGRLPPQQGRRAVHEPLRPEAHGAGPARHGEPGDLPRGQGRPGGRSRRATTSSSTCATWGARSSRRSSPTSPTSPVSTWASSRSPSRSRPSRRRTTRWAAIPTDLQTRVIRDEHNTVVEGLFAAGEVACVSVHGANRLGTNSLVDLLVFGRRAGLAMAAYCRATEMPEVAARRRGAGPRGDRGAPRPPRRARARSRSRPSWRR